MWGEWIEIEGVDRLIASIVGLSPCGESGLKLVSFGLVNTLIRSLPVWGEWIEIESRLTMAGNVRGLSPCGESGLKYNRDNLTDG